ncbi:MAG: hypothetical protein J6D54_04305 [Olsenella sp.]|nr:hypothetical protein [Olsenella sp.]
MRNPLTCPHATERRVDSHVLCDLRETPTWVTCQTSLCGEPPACAFIDNTISSLVHVDGTVNVGVQNDF